MENKFTRTVFDRSPPLLRSVFASGAGWMKQRRRFSGEYPRWADFFRAAERWPRERVDEYQAAKLRDLVQHAAVHVPWYRDAFRRWGVDPASIRHTEDLASIPILEKADVVAAGDRLISDQAASLRMNRFPTSGSTGTPLVVPHTEAIEQMEWAFLHTRFMPPDTANQPYATFSGLELLPPDRSKPPFWVDNWAARQRMFSIFHMNDRNLPSYVEALDRRYTDFCWGYPSAIFNIAEFMLRKGLRLRRPPRYVLGASEEMQPHYESALVEAFGADVRQRYGQNELVGSITKYECGQLHADLDYSVMEFIQSEVSADGEILAEIIGTNIHDPAWPLLRYRTGDLVVYHPDDACDCGRPGPVIRRIHGRTGRYFTLPNGSRVTNISVIAKKCTRVRLMQVVQSRLGSITIRVVRDDGYGESDEARLVHEFQRKLGGEIELDIDYVDDIARTRGGKYISIVNEIAAS